MKRPSTRVLPSGLTYMIWQSYMSVRSMSMKAIPMTENKKENALRSP